MRGDEPRRWLSNHAGCWVCKPDDRFLDLFATCSNAVYLTDPTITARAIVVGVIITPAPLAMPFECLTGLAVGLGTAVDLPAGNQCVEAFDAFDAQFFFLNR